MTTQHTSSEGSQLQVEAAIGTTIENGRGIIERHRERTAARKRARLVSERGRRFIARWLRRTANVANDPNPISRRQDVLLHHRAAAVRTELLEIAAMLESAHAPDPACMAQLHELLANGCSSPLYNADIHISELRATLYGVRAGLGPDCPSSRSTSRGVAVGHTPHPAPGRSHA
jgi:hypothetical protein